MVIAAGRIVTQTDRLAAREDADDIIAGYRRPGDPFARSAFLRTLRAVVDLRGQVVTMLDRSYLAERCRPC